MFACVRACVRVCAVVALKYHVVTQCRLFFALHALFVLVGVREGASLVFGCVPMPHFGKPNLPCMPQASCTGPDTIPSGIVEVTCLSVCAPLPVSACQNLPECLFVCMHVCMHVCMYVCLCMSMHAMLCLDAVMLDRTHPRGLPTPLTCSPMTLPRSPMHSPPAKSYSQTCVSWVSGKGPYLRRLNPCCCSRGGVALP
jgi:hypothetical protein